MKALYDMLSTVVKAALPIAGIFNHKMKLGARGRERSWGILDSKIKQTIPKIWVHVASLGEYEQVVPVLELLNRDKYQVVLTFFSPSGYEHKKNTSLADVVCYLPIDTFDNSVKFLDLVDPSLAIMVKYEFWPNYLQGLKKRKCSTILISGVFREKMTFHAWYGKWMQSCLTTFDHFFLQNEDSLIQLNELGFSNATVNGDTRYDRASQLIERDNTIDTLEQFVGDNLCLVIGSSWPEDIAIIQQWLEKNDKEQKVKVIIAPHEVQPSQINELLKALPFKPLLWSDLKQNKTDYLDKSTLVINTIGLLTKVYSYANIAYVGGGMGTNGLHNILEAATYGVPVIIGKNYSKYPEAGKLEDLGGLFSVKTTKEFNEMMNTLLTQKQLREKSGMIAGHWINSNTGATREIVEYLKNKNADFIIT